MHHQFLDKDINIANAKKMEMYQLAIQIVNEVEKDNFYEVEGILQSALIYNNQLKRMKDKKQKNTRKGTIAYMNRIGVPAQSVRRVIHE